ncbi:hypothetical protein L3V83_13495 [Thiotrichales bacterium 19X7-9]|nr:hypothetical protein [Thiotrichales bacterium 19X7-9]
MAVKKTQLDKLFGAVRIGNTSHLTSTTKKTNKKPNTNPTQLDTKPNTNSTQLDTKPNTNSTQLDTKPNTNSTQLDTKPNTNPTQLDTKPNTNPTQLDTKPNTNPTQLDTKPNTNSTQLDTKPNTNPTQLDTKPNTNSTQLDTKKLIYNVNNLSGNELKIFNYIALDICSRLDKRQTQPLTKKQISDNSSVPIGSINTSISRLISKQLIRKLDSIKGGKNATAIYTIPIRHLNEYKDIYQIKSQSNSSIYNNITNIDKLSIHEKSIIDNLQKQVNILNEKSQAQINSSEEMNTNIANLENDFSTVDFSELSEFGFKKSHLDQIKSFGTVTPEVAQESINHYAWALHNRKEEMQKYAPEKNRFKGLFGVLRKGNAWTEDGYIDPIDEAIQKSLDAKRKKLAQVKKQKEEMFLLDFELWKESLSEDDLNKINNQIKSKTQGRKSGAMYEAALKDHFKNNFHTSR